MVKETRVLLVKVTVGRGTIRHLPLNQDQNTHIFSVEEKGNQHGYMMEMVPAIKRFGCYYTIVKLPDGTEQIGNVFFNAKNYTAVNDSVLVRKGLINYLKKMNEAVEKAMKTFQRPTKSMERYFESLAV